MSSIRWKGMPLALAFFSLAFLSLACGGSGSGGGAVQTVTLTPVGNEMKYAVTEITAKAGSQLHVVMNNTATQADMHHNFTLLNTKPSDEATIQEVGMAAIQMGEAGNWLPNMPVVLAHTPIALPGQQTEVTFKVPPPGDYAYICTYNAHYATMRGTLHSQ
jgi:azurin